MLLSLIKSRKVIGFQPYLDVAYGQGNVACKNKLRTLIGLRQGQCDKFLSVKKIIKFTLLLNVCSVNALSSND